MPVDYHGWTHRPKALGGTDPVVLPVVLFIKVTGDRTTDPVLTTGDGQFIFEISRDMDEMKLIEVESYVTTVSSSGLPTIQLRKVDSGDLLNPKCSIDASEKNSKDAATQPVITDDGPFNHGDHISIDVDVAGTGAKGLGVILTFGRV